MGNRNCHFSCDKGNRVSASNLETQGQMFDAIVFKYTWKALKV